ncbi:MAG: ATP-binding protein [Oscillospiraceae bacterium]
MKNKRQFRLFFYFISIVLMVLIIMLAVAVCALVIMAECGVLPQREIYNGVSILLLVVVSICISLVLSLFVWNKMLMPVTILSRSFKKVAGGDFSVRLSEDSNVSEMREMAQSFNYMVKELAGTEALRSDFVVSVSHEFKTPLTAIEGYAALLQNSGLSEAKRSEYIEKIIENTSRLSDMTGNILRLSKLENQEMITDKRKYRLDEQLRRTVLMLENIWSVKDISFDIALPKKYIFANEGMLHLVWYNLISNAVKFTPAGGVIAISLEETERCIIVSVSDNGCGMTEEVQRHIFEKFYQGDSARKAEGNGLGLPLVKRIVELCGGSITVRSELSKGSEFTVTLPREQDG